MADNKYSELKNSFYNKLKEFVDSLTPEEQEWALRSLGHPFDAGKKFVDLIAEKIMKTDPAPDNDKLLVVALSPSQLRLAAASKILENNPSDRDLVKLMMQFESLGDFALRAGEMHKERLLKGLKQD